MCFAAGFRRVSYVFDAEISKDVAVGRRHSQYLYSPNYSVNEFKTAGLTDSGIFDEWIVRFEARTRIAFSHQFFCENDSVGRNLVRRLIRSAT
jgi:hypothetical protein